MTLKDSHIAVKELQSTVLYKVLQCIEVWGRSPEVQPQHSVRMRFELSFFSFFSHSVG